MASSKRSSFSLPIELVEDILYRIPIESVVRFKSVCKQWYALLNDKKFIYKHLDLSPELFIQLDHPWVKIFNTETYTFSCPQGIYSVDPMVHCDGLLLCKGRTTTYLNSMTKRCSDLYVKLAVWNPFLRQVKWIELSSDYHPFDIFGFGYDNASRDNYKILRYKCQEKSLVEIYEFKSKLWTSVHGATREWRERPNCKAVSMNGNIYWVAGIKNKKKSFIQSFDFSKERFERICNVPFDTLGTIIFSGFRGDRLSLLHQYDHKHRHMKIEVWVTKEKVTDGFVSWSKYFKVTLDDPPTLYSPYVSFPKDFIHKTDYFMVWCEKIKAKRKYIYANVYEAGEGREMMEQQVKRGTSTWFGRLPRLHCYVYVPSLVPVPE